MKKLLALFFCFINFAAFSQTWMRTYGYGMNAYDYYVINTYDKGFIHAANIHFGRYMWIFKTDINGNMIWDKKFGIGLEEKFFSPMNVEETLDRGYIICGSTLKYGSYDAFIMKLNFCGEIEWCKDIYTPNNFDEGFVVKQTPEGDYVLLEGYMETQPYSNISLLKFNAFGDLIWHQFYPLDSLYYDDMPFDLLVDNDGYLITTDRYFPDPGGSNGGYLRSNFIKTDTSGNQVWNTVYVKDGYFYSNPWSTIKNQYGHYYSGITHTVFGQGEHPAIIKVLHSGEESYYKDVVLFNNFNYPGIGTINILNDTNLIMEYGWNVNGIKIGLIKTDTMGDTIKSIQLSTVNYAPEGTVKDRDNKFLTIANRSTGSWYINAYKVNSDLEYDSLYTYPFVYDSLCPHPIVSDTVDPDCDNTIVDVSEPFTFPGKLRLKVFPNPATDLINVEIPEFLSISTGSAEIPSITIYYQWKSSVLEVFDIQGKQVYSKEIPKAQKTIELDVSKWPAGMYFFRLLFNGKLAAGKKVVVQR